MKWRNLINPFCHREHRIWNYWNLSNDKKSENKQINDTIVHLHAYLCVQSELLKTFGHSKKQEKERNKVNGISACQQQQQPERAHYIRISDVPLHLTSLILFLWKTIWHYSGTVAYSKSIEHAHTRILLLCCERCLCIALVYACSMLLKWTTVPLYCHIVFHKNNIDTRRNVTSEILMYWAFSGTVEAWTCVNEVRLRARALTRAKSMCLQPWNGTHIRWIMTIHPFPNILLPN